MFNRFFVSLVALFALAAPVSAQHIFSDGFESGDASAWGAGKMDPTFSGQGATPSSASVGEFHVDTTLHNLSVSTSYFVEKWFLCRGGITFDCGWSFTIEKETSPGVYATHEGGTVGIQVRVFGSPTGDTPSHWKVGAQISKLFEFSVTFTNSGGTSGKFRLRQTGFSYGTSGTATQAEYLVPLGDAYVSTGINLDPQSLTADEELDMLLEALPYPVGTDGVLTYLQTKPGGILELVE